MTLTQLKGYVRFKVAGQQAQPKWMQTALQDALAKADAPPESLRFQCRIATDARANLAEIKLKDGETLRLHPKSQPQFGKNHNGDAYLTATMTYSGDGKSYALRWVGDAVPQKMQQIAVKHDKGLAVAPVTIALDLSAAQIAPSWKASGKRVPPSERNAKAEYAAEVARKAAGLPKANRGSKRHCARITDADLA